MKKLLFLMMALLVAPAMANVVISVVDNGDCSANIVITATGVDTVDGAGVYSLVAGIALEVTLDAGQIDSVTGFKDDGESTAASQGYGIYLGTMTFTGGDPEAILDVGTPVAPAGAPDGPPQPPGLACVLELGCLYDVSVPGDAPDVVTVLCRLNLSGADVINVSLAGNATRGNTVLIGGDPPSNVDYVGAEVTCAAPDCYTGPDLAEWIGQGKPESWCNPRQCHGDHDAVEENTGWSMAWVWDVDITALVIAYNEGFGAPAEDLSCDFDHQEENPTGWALTRVGDNDLSIAIFWYAEGDTPADCLTATPAGNCTSPPCPWE